MGKCLQLDLVVNVGISSGNKKGARRGKIPHIFVFLSGVIIDGGVPYDLLHFKGELNREY